MYGMIERDPALAPYEADIELRVSRYIEKKKELLQKAGSLVDFANAYKWYGFHREDNGWVYREWAPEADRLYITGDFNGWHWTEDPLSRLDNGDWEIRFPEGVLQSGSRVMTITEKDGQLTQHIPLYARRAVQDPENKSWCCEVTDDEETFEWTDAGFKSEEPPVIYEAHVGMSSEDLGISDYRSFADDVLPHIKDAGYNTVQLMAVMEHPYYGSFGYQVSSFYAASSRFGYPSDLKYLINKAHDMGLRVLLDVVHSHAVANTLEGLNMFDGTVFQFFHEGPKGDHPAWGTKLFNYDKPEVIHFLLSDLKFWMEEYHFDGFRFDGVTSMLYHDHGLGVAFTGLDMYFSMNTDVDAITYLQLANELIHTLRPDAVTIAEDMSGMPGMCEPQADGGIGFDYRLGMGIPDMWIRLIKEKKDEEWNLGDIWHELTFRMAPTIAYAESHDQALVGDKTIMFRLADKAMYDSMRKDQQSDVIDRAMALHKMIRLITIAAGGDGYLAFMGNEFGHPEWIDFPREGNGDSYQHCRRQWSLLADPELRYGQLYEFDRDMIRLAKDGHLFGERYPQLRWMHEDDRVLAFERAGMLFVFNFSADKSYEGYTIPVSEGCDYEVVLCSDDARYGGQGRIERIPMSAYQEGMEGNNLRLYLPTRTAIVLKPVDPRALEDRLCRCVSRR